MRQYFIILFTTLALSTYGQSGNEGTVPDSLLSALQTSRTDSIRMNLLLQLSDYWGEYDSTRGVDYALQALRISTNDYDKGLAHFYLGRAYFEYDVTKAQQAFMEADNLLKKYTTPQAYVFRSRCWANYGSLEQRKNNSSAYIDIILNKAIPFAEKGGDSIRVAQNYSNIGLPFMNFKENDKAILYFTKAIEIFRRHSPQDLNLADCYANVAKVYTYTQKLPEARRMLDSAWKILQINPSPIYLPYYYLIEGMYFSESHDWQKAESSYNKGLAIAEKNNWSNDIRQLLYGKIDLYKRQQNYQATKKALLQLYNAPYLTLEIDRQLILKDLATTDSALGNTLEAYRWLRQYSMLADSVNAKQTLVQMADLEAKYNYSQKEYQVIELKSKAKMQNIMLWSSLAVLLLSILLFSYLYKLRKVKTEQQIRSFQQQQQISVTRALLQGEEKERSRLARDLHDGLGGMLAGVKINLSDAIGNGNNAKLTKVINQVDEAVGELRRIARNMMPESLSRSGLKVALNDLCQSINTDQLRVELQFLNKEPMIPKQVQIIIYRIVQELLSNIIKHANATEVLVQCSQHENIFYIAVEDNGTGFNVERMLKQKKGMGLENIYARVEFLKGKIDINSSAEGGTIINIELAIHENN